MVEANRRLLVLLDIFGALLGLGRIEWQRYRQPLELRQIREVESKRRDRDEAALHRPQIGPRLGLLDRNDREPEVWPAHRVLVRDDPPVIVAHGLSRPRHPAW